MISIRPCARLVAIVAFVLGASCPTRAQDTSFQQSIKPFLAKHCVACHGEAKQESRLRLDTVAGMQTGNRHLWTAVYERLASGEMPPADRPQPSDIEKTKVLAWIKSEQRALGVGSGRRLNRRELGAALQDVTGLSVDFSFALPGDGTVAGFDTGAEGLQEASDAVAQWLAVTRRAVDGIRFLEPPKSEPLSLNFREIKEPARKGQDPWKMALDDWKNKDGVTVRGRATGVIGKGLLLEPRSVGERETLNFVVPTEVGRQSIFRLTLDVSVWKPDLKGIPNPRLWVTIGGKDIDFAEISGTLEKPRRLEYDVHLGDLVVQSKGVSIHLSNKIEIPYAVEGYENEDRTNPKDKDPPPGGTGPYRPAFDRKLPPEKQPAPHIVIQRISIDPDRVSPWPPESWNAGRKLADDEASATWCMSQWLERAWRRPATEKDRVPFMALYQKLRTQKMSFDDALRASFQSVLLSAPFRYQASPAHADLAQGHYAIASRLSFMLVGGPPDRELLDLAKARMLRDRAVLGEQVDRLLALPASKGFVRPFVLQWLEMEQPITIAQDHIQKQDFRFARYLKASMREETLTYVNRLIAENRPAKELIVSDWTMMNDALARHYGYPEIEGGELRKVTLRPEDPRGGGLLGHAGLQSMLCWMGENWVIYRGAWALRHILDHPPPPPPLEVPELNPSDGKNRGKPFRELLKQHQQDSRCSVCHRTIDPVGFAFQNFDISGRWRDREFESYARGELDGRIAWRGVGVARPVDSVGKLPRGEEFKTFADFKNRIVENYQNDLVRGLLKNLFVYGVGRMPGIDENAQIAAILDEQRKKGYPLRDLIKAVVRSPAFLEEHQPVSKSPLPSGEKP